MKHLKIAVKLILSFSIVILLAAVVGGIGIRGMYSMNAADEDLYNKRYLPTVLAGDISQHITEQRTYARNLIIFNVIYDAEVFNKAMDDLTANKAEMEEMFKAYELTFAGSDADTEDQKVFREFLGVYRDRWMPALDGIVQLGLDSNGYDSKYALTDAAPIAEELDRLAAQLQRINLDAGKTAVDSNKSLFTMMVLAEIVVLVFAVGLAVFFAVRITRLLSTPMVAIAGYMKNVGKTGEVTMSQAEKNLSAKLAKNRDEIGELTTGVLEFVRHVEYIAKALETVAGGDLSGNVNVLSEKDVMGVSLRDMLDSLNSSFSQIQIATAQVTHGSKQIAGAAQTLAQGSTEQAGSIEELSASTSEISAKTKVNAELAEAAAAMAESIRKNAEKGSAQMSGMMSAMGEISDASQSINRVIKAIDEIAFQTNILALNAAVEAARAGQRGKGFAVVAEEVRNLAAKSAEAASDTGSLIKNSIEKAELGAKIAKSTATSLNEIVTSINENSRIIAQISHSSVEQSGDVLQINSGIDQVTHVVQQNSATAEESAAASEELSSQAVMLERLMKQFRLRETDEPLPAVSEDESGRRPERRRRSERTADRSPARTFALRYGDKY